MKYQNLSPFNPAIRLLPQMLLLVILAGCVTAPPQPSTRWTSLPPRPAILAVQYATSTGGDGCETAEIFIVNPGSSAVTFTNAVLDGVELSGSRDTSARLAAKRFRFDIGGRNLSTPPPSIQDERVIWSQFNPAPSIAPGETGLFQIGFRDKVCHGGSFQLSLNASDGTRLETTIPRCFPPRRQIMAVTWSPDGSIVNIQYTKGTPPKSLLINGEAVPTFRILDAAGKGRPGVLIAKLPRPVVLGQNFFIELDFGGDDTRRAFLRAFPGITIDAPNGWKDMEPLPADIRHKYGFDDAQSAMRLSFDIACDDTRAKRHGNSAPDVAASRLSEYKKNPDRLYGVCYCTAMYKAIWNIYAPISDVSFVKPYQLHWGPDPTRFIENEDARIAAAVAGTAPRPVIWVPERFKRNRYVEGEELKVLAWTAFLRGAKGIRYHYWKNNAKEPFADCVDIDAVLPGLNRDINSVRSVLSSLIPAGVREDRTQMTSTYEGWSGDSGVLLLVRNMRYTTDEAENDDGRNPRFQVATSENVPVVFAPPPWLHLDTVIDPLTREKLAFTKTPDGKLSIILPHLGSFSLIWIPNTDPTALLHLR